ncbi:hypothetical protein BH09BAC1_BH09BAC1_14840 [soil metagenome]
MKKIVLLFGFLVGLLLSGNMLLAVSLCYNNPDMEMSETLGYLGLIIIFSLILVAIKVFRDKYNHHVLTIWQGFKVGAYISLIASTMYVVVWLVDYYVFAPDFIDKYTEHVLLSAERDGATTAEIAAQTTEMAEYKQMYQNPAFVIMATYAEVLPFGLVFSFIGAIVFRRKGRLVNEGPTHNNLLEH